MASTSHKGRVVLPPAPNRSSWIDFIDDKFLIGYFVGITLGFLAGGS